MMLKALEKAQRRPQVEMHSARQTGAGPAFRIRDGGDLPGKHVSSQRTRPSRGKSVPGDEPAVGRAVYSCISDELLVSRSLACNGRQLEVDAGEVSPTCSRNLDGFCVR